MKLEQSFTRMVSMEAFDVYVGRRMEHQFHITGWTDGRFGNPYSTNIRTPAAYQMFPLPHEGIIPATRTIVIRFFTDYLVERLAHDEVFRAQFAGLRGKRLGCWCRPGWTVQTRYNICHADVIATVLREVPEL